MADFKYFHGLKYSTDCDLYNAGRCQYSGKTEELRNDIMVEVKETLLPDIYFVSVAVDTKTIKTVRLIR